jgi:hypothetical protein
MTPRCRVCDGLMSERLGSLAVGAGDKWFPGSVGDVNRLKVRYGTHCGILCVEKGSEEAQP